MSRTFIQCYSVIYCFLGLILLSCSPKNDEKELVQSDIELMEENELGSNIQPISSNASLMSFTSDDQTTKQKAKREAKIESLKKSLSINSILNSNLPFKENKGQLEKWHNIKIDKIGDIKYYSQAFGGSAYFGQKGIGIGFHTNHLNIIHKEKVNNRHHPKLGKSLFFYINHLGCNEESFLEGLNQKEGIINYFKGTPDEHITDIHSFNAITYNNLYDNVDLKYYLNERDLMYDYIIKPGGNIADIKRSFDGVEKLSVNNKGELELHTEWGVLIDKALYSYQIIDGKKKEVKVQYQLLSNNVVGFKITGKYDPTKELVIDPPTVSFSTWVNPGGIDGYIFDLDIDASSNIYVCGWTNGSNNASLVSPFDATPPGGEALIFKLTSDGTALTYASFIGGDGSEIATSVAVNSSGEAYVSGYTNNATNFPSGGTVTAPLSTSLGGSDDIFIVKINAAGNALIYSALYGDTGEDRVYGIDVNASDELFLTGWTTSTSSFSTAGAYQTANAGGAKDAFVMKVSDPTAGTVVLNYCTYYGGTGEEMGRDLAVNGANVYIVGTTTSTASISSGVNYTFGGGSGGGAWDAYIACINGATGNNRVYGTYIGGDFDERGSKIALNGDEAYITGWSKSIKRTGPTAGGFPFLNPITGHDDNAQPAGNVVDAFVAHVDATGVLQNATMMGVAGIDNGKNFPPFNSTVQQTSGGIDVNSDGTVVVAMSTDAATGTIELEAETDGTYGGGAGGQGDAYLFVLAPDMQTITFATYFGGDGNDYPTAGVHWDADCIVFGGSSHSSTATLATTAGVYATSRVGGTGSDENYVVKICDIPMPVELVSFTANENNGIVELNWTTATEENNDYFEVLRSTDGKNFIPIGVVKGSGNSSSIVNYTFIDNTPLSGISYYQLQQFDFDGKSELSDMVHVNILSLNDLKIYPNPTTGIFNISNTFKAASNLEIKVWDVVGKELIYTTFEVEKGAFEKSFDLSTYSNGVYTIQINSGQESEVVQLIKE